MAKKIVEKKQKVFLSDYPEALKLWDFEKNKGVDPRDLPAHSHRMVHWKCPAGPDHEWECSVGEVTRSVKEKRKACPICHGSKVVPSNCLATTHPQIAQEWHPTKNGALTPSLVTAGSTLKAWWKCPQGDDHEWEALINNKVKHGCPFCSGKKVSKTNNLEVMFPEIAKQWHPTKNGSLLPSQVTVSTNKKVVWLCPEGHEYIARIDHRTFSKSGCPFCSGHKLNKENSLEHKRPDLAQEWHPTKNGALKPSDVHFSSRMDVWWRCSRDPSHEWKATVDNRNKGNGCPICNSGCSLERMRLFISSLLPLLGLLNEAETYSLCLKSGVLNASRSACGRSFIRAFATGRFPKAELEKFVNNEPSKVDDFVNNEVETLEDLEEDLSDQTHCLPDSSVSNTIQELPVLQANEVLTSVDHHAFSAFEEQDIQFFIKSAVAKIWQHAFIDESSAINQVERYEEKYGLYAREVKSQFLGEYRAAKALKIPPGYSFSVSGITQPPNLMQLHTAHLVKSRKKLGNWSGTGAGKTLAAILASRVIDARITIICCPNSVMSGWKEKIEETYPDSKILVKDVEIPRNHPRSKPCYVILNYEFFQSAKGRSRVKQLLDKYKIDFVVVDEIHYSKQRYPKISSIRKQTISSFLQTAGSSNENLHILGMSATPVINNLYEGKTLLELVTSTDCAELKTKPTVANCIAMYEKFVCHGIRLMPRYSCKINIITESLDCSEYLPEIRKLGKRCPTDDLDGILIKAKLPYILSQIRPKTVLYAHFWNKNGALDMLQRAIVEKGWKVAVFTGESKDGFLEFVEGSADVLIASSCIGTGVDRLQHVCSRMIIASLPWTHAAFEQLKGRIYRQGQNSEGVDILIPLTYANVNGQRWSWCESRWNRIQFKKSVADAAVDGVVPEGHLQTPEQALQAVMSMLNNISS